MQQERDRERQRVDRESVYERARVTEREREAASAGKRVVVSAGWSACLSGSRLAVWLWKRRRLTVRERAPTRVFDGMGRSESNDWSHLPALGTIYFLWFFCLCCLLRCIPIFWQKTSRLINFFRPNLLCLSQPSCATDYCFDEQLKHSQR